MGCVIGWAFGSARQCACDPDWQSGYWDGVMWASSPVDTGGASRAVISWNARVSALSGLRFDVAVRKNGCWSDWVQAGEWGDCTAARESGGAVRRDVDVCSWDAVADALRLRCTGVGTGVSSLRYVTIAFDGPREADQACVGCGATRILRVPFRSQFNENRSLADRICGPTSLAMVMSASGCVRSTASVAALCYDPTHDIYGNWARLAAVAGDNGFVAWVQHLSGIEELRHCITEGCVPIVSVAYGSGDLGGSPISSTAGHLMVVRGVDGEGRVVCNDPAFRDDSGEGVKYKASEFARAWLGHGGTAIIIRDR